MSGNMNVTYNLSKIKDIIETYDRDNSEFIVKTLPKENSDYEKYIVKYKKDCLNSENNLVNGLYRSVVVFKNVNTQEYQVKCFSPPKSSSYNNFIENNEFNDCIITEIVDGTMMNLFYDDTMSEWVVCTKSNFRSNCKFNLDVDLTFKQMFEEAFECDGLTYDYFNKQYCYSFVLQHPSNRIVTPVSKPTLYLTTIYECKGTEVRYVDELHAYNRVKKPEKFKIDEFIALFCGEYDDEWLQLTYVCSEKLLRYDIPGYNIYNKDGVRTKIRNLSYEYVKRMKGNGQKRLFTYLQLRKSGNLNEFMEYYPEYVEEFDGYKDQLYDWTDKLYNTYVDCFILKNKTLKNADFELKPILYDIQKEYLTNLMPNSRKVNFKYIVNYVKQMPIQKIMFSMNYALRPKKVQAQAV